MAQYYHFIAPLVPSPLLLTKVSKIPFIQSQYNCYLFLQGTGAKLPRPTPPRAEDFFTDFKIDPPMSGFQRKIMSVLNKDRADTLISQSPPSSPDRARFNSLSDKSSGIWLSTPPISSHYFLPNPSFNVVCRMRLGIQPFDEIKTCLCGTSLASQPLHFLVCHYLRSAIITRHDRILQTLHKISRLIGVTVMIEPRLAVGEEGSRSDGHFFFSSFSAHVDVAVVHPAAPTYLNLAHRPLAATNKREKEKNSSYAYAAQRQGSLFFPSVFESFGTFGPEAIRFLSKLADEAIGNNITEIDDQPVKAHIYRSLSFVLQSGNANILLYASRLARARAHNLVFR